MVGRFLNSRALMFAIVTIALAALLPRVGSPGVHQRDGGDDGPPEPGRNMWPPTRHSAGEDARGLPLAGGSALAPAQKETVMGRAVLDLKRLVS